MKIPRAFSPQRAYKGFTLMEVLVVMVIIVVLATLTISIYTWLETRKFEQTTEVIVKRIDTAMENYHKDYGSYPYGSESPFRNKGVAVADGGDYSSNVVYMALFGDYKNEGHPTSKDAPIYDAELNPAEQPAANPTVQQISVKNKKGERADIYVLVDPWGSPFRYRLGCEQPIPNKNATSTKLKMGTGVNPDFDFWSYGKDGDSHHDDMSAPESQDDIGNLPKL